MAIEAVAAKKAMTRKQKTLLFSAVAIVAATGGYFIYRTLQKRRQAASEPMESRRGNAYHHTTDVFSRAKRASADREEY